MKHQSFWPGTEESHSLGRHERHFCGRRSEMGEEFGRRWGGRHWGGRFAGRIFDSGELRLIVLKLIAEKPRYGYEIIKDIEDMLAGAYAPSPGVIYPTLTMLEEQGYAKVVASEGSKKLYEATEEGRQLLAANKSRADAAFERIAQAGEVFGRGRAPQIVRAIESFRFALRMKTSQGGLKQEQINKIVEIINQATRAIEEV